MIIFFYGEDDFRSSHKIKELKEKFLTEIDKSGNSLHVLDGASTTLKEINERAGAQSLLSSKNMVVVQNIFLNKKKELVVEVLEFLKEKENSSNIIIFREDKLKINKKGNVVKIDSKGVEKALLKKEKELAEFLKKQKFTQEFKRFNNVELANWIKKEIEFRGSSITPRAVSSLMGLLGNDLWQIDKEINKLINYKNGKVARLTEGGKEECIDILEVEDLVKGSFDENIFALTDAISAKNKSVATKLLEEQYLAGLSDSHLLSMIVRQIKILFQIRNALDNGLNSRQIISSLHLHPFIVQKGINQARNFTLENLKKILNKLIEIDYNMKTGKAEVRLLLNLLISKI